MAPAGDGWEPQPPEDGGWQLQIPRPPSATLCPRGARGASIEDQIRQSYFTPSPQHYHPSEPERFRDKGGRMSKAYVPSCLDALTRSHKHVPGPGRYETRTFEGLDLPEGGRLNTKPPSQLIGNSNVWPLPGPDEYTPHDPSQPTVTHGRCLQSKDSRDPKHIRDALKQSEGLPGPGAYDFERAAEYTAPFCPEGGRALMASKPLSYFDSAAKLTSSNPAPDSYILPSGINIKPNSEAVWRHESETYAESKAMVDGVLNLKMVTPGPGAYDIPESSTKPLVPPPTMKSRRLPHGMPHPFSYNCTVDLSSKFVPYRQRNSSAMIYEGKGGQKLSRPSSTPILEDSSCPTRAELRAKRRQESLIPGSTRAGQEPDPEQQPDDAFARPVSRRGGMGRRAQSAGSMISSVDHPSVKEATKHYPRLAGRKGIATEHFLPMAARRNEGIGTKVQDSAFQRYHYTQKQIQELGQEACEVSKSALEPLDLDKLMKESVKILEHKAKAQLRVEGLSRERRMRVMEEMPALFEPPSKHAQVGQSEQPAFMEADEFGFEADDPMQWDPGI